MKKIVTSLSSFATKAAGIPALCTLFFLFLVASISAQSVDHAEIGDYSKVVWRPLAGLNAVIAQEDARLDGFLATPDLQERDRAIYTAYKRMLAYTQVLIQDSKPVDEAIFEGYEKVLAEAPNDKQLELLPEGLLMTFIPVLVEVLAEPQVPDMSGQ